MKLDRLVFGKNKLQKLNNNNNNDKTFRNDEWQSGEVQQYKLNLTRCFFLLTAKSGFRKSLHMYRRRGTHRKPTATGYVEVLSVHVCF